MSLYEYVKGSPLRHVDTTGEETADTASENYDAGDLSDIDLSDTKKDLETRKDKAREDGNEELEEWLWEKVKEVNEELEERTGKGKSVLDYSDLKVKCEECLYLRGAEEKRCKKQIFARGAEYIGKIEQLAPSPTGLFFDLATGYIIKKFPGWWKLLAVPTAVYGTYDFYQAGKGLKLKIDISNAVIAAKQKYCDCSVYE
jgi:hypothetical protein